jgi:hypothetical protein
MKIFMGGSNQVRRHVGSFHRPLKHSGLSLKAMAQFDVAALFEEAAKLVRFLPKSGMIHACSIFRWVFGGFLVICMCRWEVELRRTIKRFQLCLLRELNDEKDSESRFACGRLWYARIASNQIIAEGNVARL